MKILFITDIFPYPLNTGGNIVTFQHLKTLASKHDVHLLSLVSSWPTVSELRAITSLGIKVTTVFTEKPENVPMHDFVHSVIQGKPLVLYYFDEPEFKEKMAGLLETKHFDVIHVDHLYMAQFLPKEKRQYWVLAEHNIEYRLQLGLLKTFRTSLWKKAIYAYNALTMKAYERETLKRFDQVVVLNNADATEVLKLGVSPQKVMVAPPWQELFSSLLTKKTKELLFIGNIWWPPNLDAAKWFIQEVFPKLQKKIPDISLKVIGKSSSVLLPYVRHKKSIMLLDALEDLTPHLKKARAFILPFRIGEGTRIKALTAFSWSLPVISTQKGMQGLSVKAGEHYLEAQTPDEFVTHIDGLMNDRSVELSLVKNMKEYLQENHGVKAFQQKFLANYAAFSKN